MSYMSHLDIVTRRDADTDEGCADCGDVECSCAERCSSCMARLTYENEAEAGICGPCACDAADASRDEVFA